MAIYTVNHTDPGTSPIVIVPGEINGPGELVESTNIKLHGFNAVQYGENLNESLLHMLENFASPESLSTPGTPDIAFFDPALARIGQFWYNTTINTIFVYDGLNWNRTAGLTVGIAPHTPASEGDFWWDTAIYAPNSSEFGRPLHVYVTGVWTRVVDDYIPRDGSKNVTGTLTFEDDLIVTGDISANSNLVVTGNLTVNGTQTIINTTILDVTDANITINKNGTQLSADGIAGLEVEMSDATDVSIIYDSILASRWKAGVLGAESEILTADHIQTITVEKIHTDNIILDSSISPAVILLDSGLVITSLFTTQPTDISGFRDDTNSINIWEYNPTTTILTQYIDVVIGDSSAVGDRALRVIADDSSVASIEVHGVVAGTGSLYVGESTSNGGGLVFTGDVIPASPHPVSRLTHYRRQLGIETPVISYTADSLDDWIDFHDHALINIIDSVDPTSATTKQYVDDEINALVAATDSVPPGSIMAWPADSIPIGYIECNGAPLNAVLFPELFAVIGFMYGSSGPSFRVPDMRGDFLRGMGANDPNAGTRTDRGDGITGNNVGTNQQDAFQIHNHSGNVGTGGQSFEHGQFNTRIQAENWTTASGLTGGSETRPRNTYVRFCIKA